MSHDELFVGPLGAKPVEQGLGRKMAVAILEIVRLDFALSDQPAGSSRDEFARSRRMGIRRPQAREARQGPARSPRREARVIVRQRWRRRPARHRSTARQDRHLHGSARLSEPCTLRLASQRVRSISRRNCAFAAPFAILRYRGCAMSTRRGATLEPRSCRYRSRQAFGAHDGATNPLADARRYRSLPEWRRSARPGLCRSRIARR